MAYYLNSTEIRSPDSFTVSRYKLADAGRLANGDMVMDIIALKKTFSLNYKVIAGNELQDILDILDSFDAFFTFEYEENGQSSSYTVYSGAITYKEFRKGALWYWTDVSFQLIER